MNKEDIVAIAETIKEQLIGTTNLSVLFSWGLERFIATSYKEMATLKFKVNGRIFQGYVLISYNLMDYYEIYLSNDMGTNCICDMAYFDQLTEIIDTVIESGTDKEEYNQFCESSRIYIFQ